MFNVRTTDDLTLVMDVTRNLENADGDINDKIAVRIFEFTYVPIEAFLEVTPDDTFFKVNFLNARAEIVTLEVTRVYLENLDTTLIKYLRTVSL